MLTLARYSAESVRKFGQACVETFFFAMANTFAFACAFLAFPVTTIAVAANSSCLSNNHETDHEGQDK